MANQEHVDILMQGVEVWNAWREEYPEVQPDLERAELIGAILVGANLSYTSFGDTDLRCAYLFNADLSHSDLRFVNFTLAHLSGANLSYAKVGWTTFGNFGLNKAKGLETIEHESPSSIGFDTIYHSGGNIPEAFLRGAGAPDIFIEYMHSLVGKPIEFYSCFISYSSKNQEFAQRLHNDLQGNGVRYWYAPEDLKIGVKFRVRIDESIRIYDKLLLILSEHSVRSPWVETEVETAFSKEHKTGKLALFPVKLDNTVEETEEAWAATIHRTRHIGDFTRWKEHDEYQKGQIGCYVI